MKILLVGFKLIIIAFKQVLLPIKIYFWYNFTQELSLINLFKTRRSNVLIILLEILQLMPMMLVKLKIKLLPHGIL